MKQKIYIISSIILLFVVTIVLGFYFFEKNGTNKDTLTIFGNVDIRQADLGFRVYGRVQTLYYDEGDELKPGDLMASLDKVPYEEAAAQAKAKAIQMKEEYKKVLAQFQKRTEVDQKAISQEDYDNALYNLKSVKAMYQEAKAAFAQALTNLEDTNILCPTAGTILTRIREPGSVVNIGEPVYTLSVKSPVWIRTYVTEPELGLIFPGMLADVYTDSSQVYHGHIGFISPVAEFTPKNVETLDLRTDLVYRLRVIIDNPDKWLRQGMPVTVKLKLNSSKSGK